MGTTGPALCKGSNPDNTDGLYCKTGANSFNCVTWRLFVAACPGVNQLCSGKSSAYVAAITVCNQNLF